MSNYTPEKWIWTDADFETMSWHDVHIHSIAFESYSLAFDIDYMLSWIAPGAGEIYYKHWLSPATLLFERVSDVHIDLKPPGAPIVMDVTRSEPVTISGKPTTWLWHFDCIEGTIDLRATGFRQFIRRQPILASKQFFSESERGGISFSHDIPESQIA